MKVLLVYEGYYDERQVVAVFDEQHREQAERVAELIGGDVEEPGIELNGFVIDSQPPKDMGCFWITMNKSGQVTSKQKVAKVVQYDVELDRDDGGWRMQVPYWKVETNADNPYQRKSHWRLFVRCWATSEGHAIAITKDLHASILAGTIESEGRL
jgi:hypothetical protein